MNSDPIFHFVFSPYLCLIATVLVAVYCRNGIDYINIKEIITKYLECFNDKKSKLFIFVIPAFLAQATNFVRLTDGDVLEVIALTLSVLTAMLFTIMSLLDSKKENDAKESYTAKKDKEDVRTQAKNVIYYEILLSVTMLILCFLIPICTKTATLLKNDYFELSPYTFFSFSLYWLFFQFLINLLLVVKRAFFLDNIVKKSNHHNST